ncbi:MAG: hypothetical protein A2W98_00365 [Bacteroidetes bacterium GWF2_33_38]|nr:MAG: hypothetical protein A2W98_00365 [Bacteroidetes bacterium GWF2_33_38]
MNILFFHGTGIDPVMGGISKITYLLATSLRKRSHNVFFLAPEKLNKKHDEKQYFLPDKNLLSEKNIQYLAEIISDNNIQYLINQAALNQSLSKFIFTAKNQNTKIFSVIHNSLFSRFDNISYLLENKIKENKLTIFFPLLKNKFIIFLIKQIYKYRHINHFKCVYNSSDKIIAVSPKNIADIQYMYGTTNCNKIIAINNGIKRPSNVHNLALKKKTIIWVGTTDFYNKRVDIILYIWSLIQNKIPEWNLKILGDGVDLIKAKSFAQDLSLHRVDFAGRIDPMEDFKLATILCMTSASESFGLVLVEAMSYGVIPFAFNSFPAVTDIIQNGINGFLVEPFDIEQYAERLLTFCLVSDKEKSKIARNCIRQSQLFDIDAIVNEWEKILI